MAEKQGKVTIYDVAALAGVSVSSVSRVLHNVPNVRPDVRRRVEQAIDTLEYVPNRTAQMLKTHRSYTLVHIVADVTHPFYITLHRRLRQEAEKHGYQLVLFDADQDGLRVQRLIQQSAGNTDGFICSARSVHEKLLQAFEECELPVVFTHDCDQKRFDAVFPDPMQGVKLCMEHLLQLGHRRIAFVSSAVNDKVNSTRLQVYRDMLLSAGLEVDENLIWQAGEQLDGGYRAGMQLSALENPPTAIYTGGDMLALGVLQAMHDRKWDVPGKMSVTGENNLPISRGVRPALTTVTDPADSDAEIVIGYLLSRVEGKYSGPARIVKTCGRKLIVRDSTGAIEK